MNTFELKEYLKSIIDAEKKVKEHDDKIEELYIEQSTLGRAGDFRPPIKQQAEVKGFYASVFLVSMLVIAAVVIYIRNVVDVLEDINLFTVILLSVLLSFIISVTVAPAIVRPIKQQVLNKEYKKRMKIYEEQIADDKIRIEKELKKREEIEKLIEKETQMAQDAEQAADALYSKGIIYEGYRFFDAVLCFYNYLEMGKTQGLVFNPQTGDAGAYNLYDNDVFRRAMYKIMDTVNQNIGSMSEVLEFTSSQLDSMRYEMSSYYSRSLAYQQQTLESSHRREAYAAKTAYDTAKIRRNTNSMRRDVKRIYSTVDPGGDHWFAGV